MNLKATRKSRGQDVERMFSTIDSSLVKNEAKHHHLRPKLR